MADQSQLERDLARLRETEITLQQILDNTTTVRVFAKDLDGRYLFVNRAFEQHAGRPRSEIVGRTTADIAPAGVAEGLRANDRRVIESGCALEAEEANVIRGEPRTMLANKFPLIGADGRPYAVCGISIDITERKRFAEALHRAALAVSSRRRRAGVRGARALALPGARGRRGDDLGVRRRKPHAHAHARDLARRAEPEERSSTSSRRRRARASSAASSGSSAAACSRSLRRGRCSGARLRQLCGVRVERRRGQPARTDSRARSRRDGPPRARRVLLKIFAARATAELERMRAEEAPLTSSSSRREPIFS